MIAIPNMEKPQNITRCSYKINPEECKCIYTDKVFEETLALIMDHPCPDCPLIEIVHCKDCKWFEEEGYYCAKDILVQFDHFFCYHGERRE